MSLIGGPMKNPYPYVVVRNAGGEDEDIVEDFPTWKKACEFMLGEPGTDLMKRLDDGTLTTEF